MKTKNNKLKKLATVAIAGMFALSLSGASGFAETSETTTAPQIATNQGLSEGGASQGSNSGTGSASGGSSGTGTGRVKSDANSEGNKAGAAFSSNNKAYRNKISGDTGSVVNNISNQVKDAANQAAGQHESSTGLEVNNIQERVSKLLDDAGTGLIGLGVKALYYTSFSAIIVGLIMTVVSFFFKAIKATKWIGTFIFGMIIYGIITQVLGISLLDNPLSEIIFYLLHG